MMRWAVALVAFILAGCAMPEPAMTPACEAAVCPADPTSPDVQAARALGFQQLTRGGNAAGLTHVHGRFAAALVHPHIVGVDLRQGTVSILEFGQTPKVANAYVLYSDSNGTVRQWEFGGQAKDFDLPEAIKGADVVLDARWPWVIVGGHGPEGQGRYAVNVANGESWFLNDGKNSRNGSAYVTLTSHILSDTHALFTVVRRDDAADVSNTTIHSLDLRTGKRAERFLPNHIVLEMDESEGKLVFDSNLDIWLTDVDGGPIRQVNPAEVQACTSPRIAHDWIVYGCQATLYAYQWPTASRHQWGGEHFLIKHPDTNGQDVVFVGHPNSQPFVNRAEALYRLALPST